MNDTQTYSSGAPLTASPSDSANSVITRTPDQKAWLVSVSVQAAFVSIQNTTALTATFGLTVPAGSVLFIPVKGNISCRAAVSGAIVNAIPLE